MKNDEKAIIAGAGAVLTYLFLKGKENPQLRADLLKNVFYSDTNILSNIAPYLVIALIIYLILRK